MNMKIVFASTNRDKIKEISKMLYPHEILSLDDIGFHDEIVENGESFYENALIKARTVYNFCHILTLADDSGICVEALNDEPGIYSARYSKSGQDNDNNELLLKNLKNVSNRKAKYVCALVAIGEFGEKCFMGEMNGRIIDEYRGDGGFGYDPIFFLDDYGKTAAEISMEEKNKISHRGKALREFKSFMLRME